ncbi:MAG: zeta toxin family protein [Sarcina sp.]
MKSYTVFGGVNGSGKTTMYKAIYYPFNKGEKRINTDEMVARVGSWEDDNLQMKCAKEAVKLIREYFSNGISFNQETTLSGKSIVRNIKKAKESGFFVEMNFICTESPEISKERIRERVLKGGHGIPDKAVERRYVESLENLKLVKDICDVINIYDNTKKLRLIATIESGSLTWSSGELPNWYKINLKNIK